MAYKEKKLTADEAYAFYNGLNDDFTKKKKVTKKIEKKTAQKKSLKKK